MTYNLSRRLKTMLRWSRNIKHMYECKDARESWTMLRKVGSIQQIVREKIPFNMGSVLRRNVRRIRTTPNHKTVHWLV